MLRIRLFKSALYLFVFVILYLYVSDYYEEAEGSLVPDDAAQVSSWHDCDYNVLRLQCT